MSHSKLLLTGFENSQLRWYPCLVIILRQLILEDDTFVSFEYRER